MCNSNFIISLDNLAKKALDHNVFGHVIAVFDSSIYLETSNQIICVGNKDFKNAPITIITNLPKSFSFKMFGLKIEEKVFFLHGNIKIKKTTFAFNEKTQIWNPKKIKYPFILGNVRQGLGHFHKILQNKNVEPKGLSEILFFKNLTSKRLCPSKKALLEISECRKWICLNLVKNNIECMSKPYWAENLLGLGFGLTPSGDDFIGGVMIALHICKRTEMAQCIWEYISKNISQATTPIAGAHLHAASTGSGPADIHKLANAMLTANSKEMFALIKNLDTIGQSSGWDIFAGIFVAIEALSTQ